MRADALAASAASADFMASRGPAAAGIEAEARLALHSLAAQLVGPDGALENLDPTVEDRLGMLTERLRDATGELLSVLELTRSRMIGVDLLQAHANQARILLQLYDEHQSMVEELLRTHGAEAPEESGLPEEEVAVLLQHAARLARALPAAKPRKATECVICQTELCVAAAGADKESCALQCGHSFHRSCIGRWLCRSNKCPLCRAEQSVEATISAAESQRQKQKASVARSRSAADFKRHTGVDALSPTPPANVHVQPTVGTRMRRVPLSAWQSQDRQQQQRQRPRQSLSPLPSQWVGSSASSPGLLGMGTAASVGPASLLPRVQSRPTTVEAKPRGASRGGARAAALRPGSQLGARPATSEVASDAARLMRRRATATLGTRAVTPQVVTPSSAGLEPLVVQGQGDSAARARGIARARARARHRALGVRSGAGLALQQQQQQQPTRRQLFRR